MHISASSPVQTAHETICSRVTVGPPSTSGIPRGRSHGANSDTAAMQMMAVIRIRSGR